MSYPKVYVLSVDKGMDSEVHGIFASWNDAERKMREVLDTSKGLKMKNPYDEEFQVVFDRPNLDNGRPSRGYLLETGDRIHAIMTCHIQAWDVYGTALEVLAEQAE